MAKYITHWAAEGVQNSNNGLIMKWWRTNFNMPVPNVFELGAFWNINRGPVAYSNPATSFDLSGLLPGLETTINAAIPHWDNTTTGGNVTLYTSLIRPDSTVIGSYVFDWYVPGGEIWYEIGYWFNIGIAGWEVDRDGTYVLSAYTTGYDAIGTTTTNITISNCPSVAADGHCGYIWVEGNYLAMINAGGDMDGFVHGWKHRILGTSLGGSGEPGMIWVDETTNDLCFVRADGTPCKVPWKIKQFASYFSNGPTHSVYAGTDKAGMMWMDSEFGQTHIAYIGADGWKYLCGAGDYPYSL